MDVLGGDAPATRAAKAGKISTTSDLHPCPYCGAEIAPDVIKCRHCGEFVNKQVEQQRLRELAPPKWNPGVAAVLSLVIPGAGQIYKGQIVGGIVWLFAVPVGYLAFFFPGLILHLCCIIGAYSGDPKA